MISELISNIAPSPTLSLNAKAKEMKNNGVDVLNFAVGEPDMDTPGNIKEAAKKALDEGHTKYTAAAGSIKLREAISKKFLNENGVNYSSSEIVAGSGAKPLLYAALLTLCNPGDEVILAAPYWVSYIELIKLCKAIPVFVEAKEENRFMLKANDIEEKISDKTKILLINTPSNPTGAVITREELERIAELSKKHDLYVLADEIYEKLVYGVSHFSVAGIDDDQKNRTITVNGASKAYSMTGLRLGYLGASTEIAKAVSNFLSNINGNPCSIVQEAFIEALEGPQDEVSKMRDEFEKRRNLFHEGLNKIDGITCTKPNGAFYLYANVSGKFSGEINTPSKFAEMLLDKTYIAVVPGEIFGTIKHVRFSYAASIETIEKCLGRLKEI
ncbi:aminotransferase class I/II-fold pyridoxal phosphate-dependent enzyme [Candidatus Peregrinibacteria bacterium]|nr:aminotransferase class I/II-fold pyridoxal phosphate-dependent enzyme [Candidatus Peregrinibacteria bacterium]